MAKGAGMWQKVKNTINNEVRDEEKLAANLASKDLCQIGRGLITGEIPLGRLLRAVALFAGSVFVMRNFGELMAV